MKIMDTPVSAENMRCKVFIGGVPIKIEESRLRRHFEQYGAVKLLKLVRNKKTQEPLGFAFVEYEREAAARVAVSHQHFIDDREVV